MVDCCLNQNTSWSCQAQRLWMHQSVSISFLVLSVCARIRHWKLWMKRVDVQIWFDSQHVLLKSWTPGRRPELLPCSVSSQSALTAFDTCIQQRKLSIPTNASLGRVQLNKFLIALWIHARTLHLYCSTSAWRVDGQFLLLGLFICVRSMCTVQSYLCVPSLHACWSIDSLPFRTGVGR